MDDETAGWRERLEGEINQGFSDTVIDHAMQPRNVGILQNADGHAVFQGPCGDTMEIWLSVSQEHISRATFWTDGCGTSIASGSMVTELARDKTVLEAMEINQADVLRALDGLPEESEHCALLAATTLKMAIADYLRKRREPWNMIPGRA
jgi:nitrogen fixation NifU-like protein